MSLNNCSTLRNNNSYANHIQVPQGDGDELDEALRCGAGMKSVLIQPNEMCDRCSLMGEVLGT